MVEEREILTWGWYQKDGRGRVAKNELGKDGKERERDGTKLVPRALRALLALCVSSPSSTPKKKRTTDGRREKLLLFLHLSSSGYGFFLFHKKSEGEKKGLVSVGETWKMMISTVTRRLEKTTEEKKKDEERGAYVDAIRLSSRKRWKEEMRRENRSNDLKSLRGVITIYTTIQIANDKRGRKSVVFLIHISIERKRESVCVGQYMALGTKWFSRSTSSSLEKTPRKKK